MTEEEWQKQLNKFDWDKLAKERERLVKEIREYPQIYLIKCGRYYKIGVSYDAYKRLKDFNPYNPHKLTVYYHAGVNNAYKLEAELHRRYEKDRVKNEWFKLSREQLKEIKEIIGKERR
jgi:hypothetical protein